MIEGKILSIPTNQYNTLNANLCTYRGRRAQNVTRMREAAMTMNMSNIECIYTTEVSFEQLLTMSLDRVDV